MSLDPLRLSGLVAATFTPMHADGTPALDRVPGIVEHLHRWRIAGLYVNGSTGEGVSLDGNERRAAAEAYVRAAAGRLPAIVQVGHNSLAEARQLAAHAQRIGAAAIAAMPPSYYKIDSLDALVSCMAEVASAAPETPFYYYHFPRMTGVEFDMVDLLRTAGERIANLAGMKFTAPALDQLQACVELDGGRFDVLLGVDDMLLPGLAAGVRGAVGATYNFAAPMFHQIIQAFSDGDVQTARLWQSRAVQMVRLISRRGGLAAHKAVMGLIGLDCGPTRLPLPSLSEQERQALRDDLTALGFFGWIETASHHLPTTSSSDYNVYVPARKDVV